MNLLYRIKYQLENFNQHHAGETLHEFDRRMRLMSRRLTGRLSYAYWCKRCKSKMHLRQFELNDGLCDTCIKKVKGTNTLKKRGSFFDE